MIPGRSSCDVNHANTILAVCTWDNPRLIVYDTILWHPQCSTVLDSPGSFSQGLCFVGKTSHVLVHTRLGIQEFAVQEGIFHITPLRCIEYVSLGSLSISCNGKYMAISNSFNWYVGANKILEVSAYQSGKSLWHHGLSFCPHGLTWAEDTLLVGQSSVYVLDAQSGTELRQFETLASSDTVIRTSELILTANRRGEIWVHDVEGNVLCKHHTQLYGPVFVAHNKVWCIGEGRDRLYSTDVLNWHLGYRRVFIKATMTPT